MLLVCVAGCIGGDPGRPDRSELSKAVASQSGIALDDQQAGCVADKLLASKLSDKVLRGAVRDDDGGFDQKELTELGEAIARAIRACLPSS